MKSLRIKILFERDLIFSRAKLHKIPSGGEVGTLRLIKERLLIFAALKTPDGRIV